LVDPFDFAQLPGLSPAFATSLRSFTLDDENRRCRGDNPI